MFSKKKYSLYNNIYFSGLLLITLGTLFVLSSSFFYGIEKNDPTVYFEKHILYLIFGLIAVYILQKINLKKIEEYSFFIFILTLILLPLPKIQGNLRWIKIGPFSFQPSEFVKLTYIIYLSSYFKKRIKEINNLKIMSIPAFFWILISCLLQLQKDFGTFVIITFSFVFILYFCGFKLKYIFSFLGFFLLLVCIFILMFPYRIERIKIYLNPEQDTLGKNYQTIQAKISLSSGGLFGKGPGAGTGKLKFLPEAHKDFVYAVVGEEFGFFGTAGVLILFGILIFSGLEISKLSLELFEKILAYGISILFGLQFLLHTSVVLCLLPPKGTTLPFFSVGGSSLLMNLLSFGLLLKISENVKNQKSSKDIEEKILYLK
ncbi:MAG: putative lipid II flippase FtsW [Candidatus Omnitrophica bacterium]|nr:putative lipid II flippase FtsW [Candidatus Omnitrophota bacterium]MCM8807189.1 putative lipid II flippase FtsW [Candidatus Omnitrophota bacterium]